MVNFRYHIVTLIAVFLALAVGVVLGAGPLQKAIDRGGETAPDAVALSEELAAAQKGQQQTDQFVWDFAGEVLPETLGGAHVAVILLPGSSSTDQVPVDRALELAGAAKISYVNLNENWSSPDQATYRETLAAAVSAHLQTRPAEPSSDATLAVGLIEVLSERGPATELVEAMLTDPDTPLLIAEELPSEPVTAFILVGPASQVAEQQAQSQELAENTIGSSSLWTGLAGALAQTNTPAAAVGSAETNEDFISVLRKSGVRITTVDQGGTPMAGINVALALSTTTVGAYGQEDGATRAVAPLP